MKPKLHTLGRPERLAANTATASPKAILTQGMQAPVPTTILRTGAVPQWYCRVLEQTENMKLKTTLNTKPSVKHNPNTNPKKTMPVKGFIRQSIPRLESESGMQIARQELQRCVDHPSSTLMGDKPGIDTDNEPIIAHATPLAGRAIMLDRWLAGINYLSGRASLCLRWCLVQGPKFGFFYPVACWDEPFDWNVRKGIKVLEELRAAGHAIKVHVHNERANNKPVVLWKFSERPCGLPAAELKNAVFKTTMPQFAIHGKDALPKNTPANHTNGFRLGHEIARFDGIIPTWANNW